ncbi:MAG: acyl-CoA dehydrogenase [Rhizobiales bacterium 62-17]|nr:acyl-CoA dehydrogenase C-terminal domain-containing protein [Hyphomicrobiales bacterium]OJY00466.1 MAG: acyl-CoA dehydrogenase [Rhizobiales bacterium 62-17]
MPSYQAPVADALFLLNDVLHWDRYNNLPGFADASPDVVEAVLQEAAKISEEILQPINLSGDREGCVRHDDGSVTTPKGFKEAFKAYAEGGWIGLATNPDFGGQGLPYTLATLVNEFSASANMAFTMYPGLTQSAIAAIDKHATPELKQAYLPKMIAGTWSGTMNLTEPHCGTDLGLLKTKAVPNADGSYAITGQKIFISAGEQDMTENIVHLVLARIEGAPAGTRGISLFIVPKFIPDASGNPGERNGVSCGSIEHKMGIHANSTCVMNHDGAKGWLVGEANRGLNAMFVMMNEARLGVANQGLSQSEVAYQNAVAYAKERLQGRSLTGPKSPDKPADSIMVHPDVRRMLLEIRAFNEAARALILWASLHADVSQKSPDEKQRQASEDILGLLTPVLKGVFTDRGFDNAVKAQQVFGGHGYIGEWGMEQFVRDARIAMIYEGANGIQALDLVGRKLPKDGGRALTAFLNEVGGYLKQEESDPAMQPYLAGLKSGVGHLQQATMWLMQNAMAKPDNAGAGSYDYMHLFGLVAMGYMWCKIAKAAQEKKAADASQAAAMDAKLIAGKFYMERLMPETAAHLARLSTGADTMMALPADAF